METEETTQTPVLPRSPRKRKPESELLAPEETILYDLWEIGPSWTEEEVVEDKNEKQGIKSKAVNFGKFGINGFFSIIGSKIRVGESVTSIVPPPLLEHIQKFGHRSYITLSEEGDQLLILQKHKLSLRLEEEEFAENHIVWELHEDPYPQWRKICVTPEYQLIALYSSQNIFYIIDYSEGRVHYTFQGQKLGLVDGVASICFRDSVCEYKGTIKCPELLVLGFDGILRRVHVPAPRTKLHNTPVHPLANSETSKACAEITTPIKLTPYHISVACMAFNSQTNLLAGAGASVSVWKMSDRPPYFELVRSTTMPQKQGYFAFVTAARKVDTSIIRKISFSPSAKLFAAMDLSGNVTIWNVSDFKVEKTFTAKDINHSEVIHDFSWWTDNALVFSHIDGQIGIYTIGGTNILGKKEKFESLPMLTEAVGGKFFVLSHKEHAVRMPRLADTAEANKKRMISIGSLVSLITFGYFENEENSEIVQEKLIRRTYKLMSFNQTTPAELFKRKVDMQEYGAALQIARYFGRMYRSDHRRTYGLNPDLVFQKRWASLDVTPETIKEFLDRIQDREWIRFECERRIPNQKNSNKILLEYGLKESGPSSNEDVPSEFTDDFVHICLHRLLFLIYLERLNTFSNINSEFDPNEYARYRESDLVDSAFNFAFEENFEALRVLFTYHGDEILAYKLDILSQIPETADPQKYQHLLPEVEDSLEKGWLQASSKIEDWVLESNFLKKLGISTRSRSYPKLIKQKLDCSEIKKFERENFSSGNRKDTYISLDTYSSDEQSPRAERNTKEISYPRKSKEISQWYINRAKEIEARAGQVENALLLIDLGVQKGVEDLEGIQEDLQAVFHLVYDCNVDITLEKYEKLSEYERFYLLLKESSENNVAKHIRERASYFLQKDEKNNLSMLRQFMTEMARLGKLKLCERIIYESRPIETLPKEKRIIKNQNDLIDISLTCFYATKTVNQWDIMNDMFTCLPLRDFDETSEKYQKLHDRLDAFEKHLSASEALVKHKLAPPISFYLNLDTPQAQDESRKILHQMCHQAIIAKPPFSNSQWRALLSDMLKVQEGVFKFITKDAVSVLFIESLLKAGNILFLLKHLQNVSPGIAEDLILTSAKEYFNSAASIDDEQIKMAKEVLAIAPSMTPAITEEYNLLKGVIMLSSYNVNLLPIQIRLNKNRLELVFNIIKEHSSAYKSPPSIIKLASLLTKATPQTNAQLYMLIASTALDRRDYPDASLALLQLLEARYMPAWELCYQLATTREFDDPYRKKQLLSFAMMSCPSDRISEMIDLHQRLELEIQLQSLNITNLGPEESLQALEKLRQAAKKSDSVAEKLKGQILPLHILFRNASDIPNGIYREPPKIKRKDLLEIDQMILRIQMTSGKNLDDSILLELAEQYLFKDIQLACSYLLSLEKPSIAASLFDKYIEAAQPVQIEQFVNFACYYFALSILKSITTESELQNILKSSQESILETLDKRLEKEETQKIQSEVNIGLLNKYRNSLKEIKESQVIEEEIVEEEFQEDPELKQIEIPLSKEQVSVRKAIALLSSNHLHHQAAFILMENISNIHPSSSLYNINSGFSMLRKYLQTKVAEEGVGEEERELMQQALDVFIKDFDAGATKANK